ncbi:Zinc finger CCCH domain-containing protein [Actinidia chinensis var. chinensis]|uniref:Zinc finger CCCH domain-containing protein n=1 Tax=Actinidia chinensis var. chinensis TaxID=1590841 RepID=A0A2R6PMK1_ACTCC|nr:Zinc finger CCCH domain-containing protein [Actinidia chinensis var. chinensis]
MDYGREVGFSSGNVVQILTGTQSNGFDDNWGPGSDNQAIWATEDDYRDWTRETSVETISQTRSGSEPPNKKSRNSQSGDNRSKAIGKMFFKTKLCCKFRARTCPYTTNCNFAHSVEELRRPPPNWQEIVAAHEEERGVSSEPREEFQIPALESSAFEGEAQRSYKGRHCKKFYTEEGCPYGDNCTFLHDEQSRARESVAISLGPGSGGGGGGTYGNNATAANLKPSNWKTRICNKWELTGYCPFGNKCHFAHGAQELHRYGGGLMEGEDRAASSASPDRKQGAVPSKIPADTVVASMTSVPHSDGYHIGVPSQRLSNVIQRTGQRPHQKWKGPDKISRIYGDWIDDAE